MTNYLYFVTGKVQIHTCSDAFSKVAVTNFFVLYK